VLDRARLPAKPRKPERPLLYTGGSVIGLALALSLGFIAELRQNVILGEWELKDDSSGARAVAAVRNTGMLQSNRITSLASAIWPKQTPYWRFNNITWF
jgi:hypothetical protein